MAGQNTQFPERDRDVVTYTAFNGLRNDVSPERFELGDLAAAQNIDIDKSGRIARREGYELELAVDAHSIWADEEQEHCLFVQGNTLQRLQADMTSVAVASLTSTARMSYTRVSDRIYLSNGTDKGIFEAGALRTWGMPVAPLPAASAIVGNMPAGTYQFAMTWLRADGQESGCGLAGQIELGAGSGIQFELPPAPQADIVGRVLFLSPANSDNLLEAVTIPVATTSLAWQQDPANLASPLMTQFFGPPPAGQLVAYYRGHLFVAVGDTIYVSADYGYELFNLRKYLQLDGRITLLAPMTDKETSVDTGDNSGFFVGTDRSMGVIVGTDPASFQYVPKVPYGAIEGALAYVDATLVRDGGAGARKLPMWLSAKGVCIGLPGMLINNLTRARFDFAAGGQGAAVILPSPNRFIATCNF